VQEVASTLRPAEVIQLVLSLVAAVAVIYSLAQVRAELRLQVFFEYTRRFDQISASLPAGALDRPWVELPVEDAARTEAAMRQYIDLCSQEWWLNSAGRIDRGVWEVWERAIAEMLATPGGSYAWQTLRPGYLNVFPGFAAFMDEAVAAGAAAGR